MTSKLVSEDLVKGLFSALQWYVPLCSGERSDNDNVGKDEICLFWKYHVIEGEGFPSVLQDNVMLLPSGSEDEPWSDGVLVMVGVLKSKDISKG